MACVEFYWEMNKYGFRKRHYFKREKTPSFFSGMVFNLPRIVSREIRRVKKNYWTLETTSLGIYLMGGTGGMQQKDKEFYKCTECHPQESGDTDTRSAVKKRDELNLFGGLDISPKN